MEREIASACRKAARRSPKGEAPIRITPEKVNSYLGRPKHFAEVAGGSIGSYRAGVDAGQATSYLSSAAMAGAKGLKLTGQIGDVMKESAERALSYIRTHRRSRAYRMILTNTTSTSRGWAPFPGWTFSRGDYDHGHRLYRDGNRCATTWQ